MMRRSSTETKVRLSVRLAFSGATLVLLTWLAPDAAAAPSGWPADADWIHHQFDPDEGGVHNDQRDVEETFYAVREGFLFLRMKNRGPAGWCSVCGQSFEHARYKWLFDTANADGELQGGSVRDAEFMLMVEDLDNNRVGEVTFIDDPNNDGFTARWNSANPPHYVNNTPQTPPVPFPDWQREVGSFDPTSYPFPDPDTDVFLGVPQSVLGEDVGYRIFGGADVQAGGVYVDMYVNLDLLGDPLQLRLLWLTDQENTNLEQAPCCDRPDEGDFTIIELTGTIVISKAATPADDTVFPFSGDLGAFTLQDPSDTDDTFLDLEPGTYQVTETVPGGWALASLSCSDPDGGTMTSGPTAMIDLDAGETVSCQFVDVATPAETGTIVIVKDARPDGATSFDFTSTTLAGFSLVDNGSASNVKVFAGLDSDTYDVSETPPIGWDLDSATCSDGSLVSAIELDAGEVVTCTFVNVQRGSITIVKSADPADDTSFGYSGGLGAFILSDPSSPSQTFMDLIPGPYAVTETAPAGWDLTAIQCTDATGDSTIDLGAATANISLGPGESVTCTFANSQPGTLTVVKEALPQSPTVFSFGFGPGDFTLVDDGSGTLDSRFFDGLSPGEYEISESAPAPWALSAIVCDDPDGGTQVDLQGSTAFIDVDAGEDVVCTFMNARDLYMIPTLSPGALGLVALLLAGAGALVLRRRL